MSHQYVTRDPAIRNLPWASRWMYVACGVLARQCGRPNLISPTSGKPYTLEDLADEANLPMKWAEAAIRDLTASGAIRVDGKIYVVVRSDSRPAGGKGGLGGLGGATPTQLALTAPPNGPKAIGKAVTTQSLAKTLGVKVRTSVPKPRASSTPSPYHQVVVDALGEIFNAQSQPEWARIAAAAKIMTSANPPVTTAGEVQAIYRAWEVVYPSASSSPTALANHLGRLRQGIPPSGNGRTASRFERESPGDQFDRVFGGEEGPE